MAAPALASGYPIHSLRHGFTLKITQSGANQGNINHEPRSPLLAMSMQVTGTRSAAVITLQGSDDGTNFAALPTSTALSATGVKSVATADLGFKYYRINVASADAGDDLVIWLHGTYAL